MTHKTLDTPNAPARPKSAALWARANAVMPGGVSSPVRAFRAVGGDPVFVQRAEGPYIIDVDGRKYIDLVGSWGPAIAGHAHPAIVQAVQRAAADGLSFGACCAKEADLAEKIIAAFPGGAIEMVRFVSSGTEAGMSAARLARGFTGRNKIIKFAGHYHGHADSFLVAAGSGAATFGAPTSPGVPASTAGETLVAEFNDLASVDAAARKAGGDLAAIILEPVAGNMGFVPPDPGFLEGLRALCDRLGALLIFDEVMSGFRVAYGGYQNLTKVRPDLTCFGKVIGGGMPVAAYAGPRRIMERLSPLGPIYQAGTLSGSPIAMAAGLATLEICSQPGFYASLGERSAQLARGLQDAARTAGITVSVGSLGGMLGVSFTPAPIRNFNDIKAGDHARFGRFFHAMLDRGVWLPPSHYEAMFVSSAHTRSHIDQVIDIARDAFVEIA
jgi:glutamate-1-semialdehyde 2,1-aminomutase